MKSEQKYEVIINQDNLPIFIIKYNQSDAQNPVIVYKGGKHGFLYRQGEENDDVVVLDYLPKDVVAALKVAPFAIVMEKNLKQNNIYRSYKAQIQIRQKP